jgi:hypothetical protein
MQQATPAQSGQNIIYTADKHLKVTHWTVQRTRKDGTDDCRPVGLHLLVGEERLIGRFTAALRSRSAYKRRHRFSLRRCWRFESSVTRHCVAGWNTELWRYHAHFLEITLYYTARDDAYKLRVFYRNCKIIRRLGIPPVTIPRAAQKPGNN